MTGGLWAPRGNEWTRSQEQLDLRRKLARTYPILGRAIALREALQGVLADGDLLSIRWWLGWADRSRLEPSANSLELSKNISTASWPTWKPA